MCTRTHTRRPVVTQMATSAVLWGAGDLVAQRVGGNPSTTTTAGSPSKPGFDLSRTLLTTVYGGALVGPLGGRWWQQQQEAWEPAGTGTGRTVALHGSKERCSWAWGRAAEGRHAP